jgi:glycosyltransferase involved in cell wall biosynthesis
VEPSPIPKTLRGNITLVVAQSPRYFPHVERHLAGLLKVFAQVHLLYWEKDVREPLFAYPGVSVRRVLLPFGKGGFPFFLRLMAGFFLRLAAARRDHIDHIEAIDPYALIPARCAGLLAGITGRRPRITYFSMEYFPEQPSLKDKPLKKRAWRILERWGARGASAGATVCDPIAGILSAHLGLPFITVRNLPPRGVPAAVAVPDPLHARCGLSDDVPILVYQGMLQKDRGLEAAVRAVAAVPGIHFALIGGGPLREPLARLAGEAGCAGRIHLLGEVGHRELAALTRGALAGLAPIQGSSASYLYSLPGKIFEYIQAGLPVIATGLPEIRKIVEGYGVGLCLEDGKWETLAAAIGRLRQEPGLREGLLASLPRAQAELCWEAEEARYLSLYRN